MLTRASWSFASVLVLVAVVLFIVAFCVSVGWFGHNWFAWGSAGLAFFAAAHLPWGGVP